VKGGGGIFPGRSCSWHRDIVAKAKAKANPLLLPALHAGLALLGSLEFAWKGDCLTGITTEYGRRISTSGCCEVRLQSRTGPYRISAPQGLGTCAANCHDARRHTSLAYYYTSIFMDLISSLRLYQPALAFGSLHRIGLTSSMHRTSKLKSHC